MKEFAKIYEICDTLNVGSVSIRECGTPNKPWHYGKMQSCKDRFGQNKMWSCMAKDRVKLICH